MHIAVYFQAQYKTTSVPWYVVHRTNQLTVFSCFN